MELINITTFQDQYWFLLQTQQGNWIKDSFKEKREGSKWGCDLYFIPVCVTLSRRAIVESKRELRWKFDLRSLTLRFRIAKAQKSLVDTKREPDVSAMLIR